MSIAGCTYLERGEPVVVIAQWRHSTGNAYSTPGFIWVTPPVRTGPRNVLIERADGSRVVRGFRGLRKSTAPHEPESAQRHDNP